MYKHKVEKWVENKFAGGMAPTANERDWINYFKTYYIGRTLPEGRVQQPVYNMEQWSAIEHLVNGYHVTTNSIEGNTILSNFIAFILDIKAEMRIKYKNVTNNIN